MDPYISFKSCHLSWSGSPQAWQGVAEKAEKKRGLLTGWAKKTNRSALYTIDYDAEGWYQVCRSVEMRRSNVQSFWFKLCEEKKNTQKTDDY